MHPPAKQPAAHDITFVVPIHNAERHLARCLKSLVTQNANKEIICINDGSSDNSLTILQHWAAKHPEIRIINQENQGVSAARNLGIAEAQGRYIWFVDADDYLCIKNLAEMIALCDQHSVEILRGLIIRGYRTNDEIGDVPKPASNRVSEKYLQQEPYAELMSGINYLQGSLENGYSPKIWAGFYRTAFLREYKCRFPTGINNAEDEVFELQVFSIKHNVQVMENAQVVYFYRHNPSGSSRNVAKQFAGSLMAVTLMLEWCNTLKTQFTAAPADSKQKNLLRNWLWLARFTALRLNYYACCELFFMLTAKQQKQLKHLITPARLRDLDEFKYMETVSDPQLHLGQNVAHTLQCVERVKQILEEN